MQLRELSRLSRRVQFALGGLLLLATTLIIVWRVAQSQTEESGSQPEPETSTEVSACEIVPTREGCDVVSVDGRSYRYTTVSPSAESDSGELILLDVGGPGTSVLSGSAHIGEVVTALGPKMSDRSFLVIEEPWVTEPVSDSCAGSLTDFYNDARSAPASARNSSDAAVSECGLAGAAEYGWNKSTYSSVVEAVLRQEQAELAGFVGFSFGSVRLAYLADTDMAPSWAVLVRPFPLGATGTEILRGRAELLDAMVAGFDTTVAEINDTTTGFDRTTALVGVGYMSEADRARVGPGVASGIDVAGTKQLSDQLWQRYGVDSISPAYLAYLQEVCLTSAEWPLLDGVEYEIPLDALEVAHLPCSAEEWIRSDKSVVWPDSVKCVAAARSDTVVPYELILRNLPASVKVIELGEEEHRSENGPVECVDTVALR